MTAWHGNHRDDKALKTTGKIPVWTAKVHSSKCLKGSWVSLFPALLPEYTGRGMQRHFPVFQGWDCAWNQVTREAKL